MGTERLRTKMELSDFFAPPSRLWDVLGHAMSVAVGWRKRDRKSFTRGCVFLACLSVIGYAGYTSGQTVADQIGKAKNQGTAEASEHAAEPADPLGRSTPHGTVFGFLQAAQGGKNKEAAQFLQLSKEERDTVGEDLAYQLHELMDSAFVGRVGAISDSPEGSPQNGVPQDHERIGEFRINGNETRVDLVRTYDPKAGEIWLFSSDLLTKVPELFSQIENSELESGLPRFLTKRVLSTPLWRLIAWLLLIPVAFALAWGVVHLLRAGQRIWLRWRHHQFLEDVHQSIAGPAILILTVIFHQIGVYFLGIPLLIRMYYRQLTGVLLVAGGAWLIFRLINRWGERARVLAAEDSAYRSGSIVLLGQRILKALVVIAALLAMFSILGFDMTTAVAGLGIGSIAIAFAAQKTLENLFGGISILGDQVIRVGETCRIDDKVGTVEDISLRSTRIRTLDRTELSVPNGELANMNLENISRQDKSLFRSTIGLRQETSPDQLRSLLIKMRALLHQHPKVGAEAARVRLIGIGESSLDIQVNCYILTSDIGEFLAIREELLLRIMDLVADSATGFAVPSRALYLAHERELDERSQKAEDSAA